MKHINSGDVWDAFEGKMLGAVKMSGTNHNGRPLEAKFTFMDGSILHISVDNQMGLQFKVGRQPKLTIDLRGPSRRS